MHQASVDAGLALSFPSLATPLASAGHVCRSGVGTPLFYTPAKLGAWAVTPPPRGLKKLYLRSFGIPDVRAQLTATYLTRALAQFPSARILDVGCGNGWFPCVAAAQLPGSEVVGWDREAESIAFASRVAAQNALGNVRFEIVDVERGEMAGTYDWISCLAVLEFIDNVPLLLERLVRILEPGGHLVVQLPGTAFRGFLMRRGTSARRLPDFREMRHGFSEDESGRLMRAAGLEIVSMETVIKGPTIVAKELFYLALSVERRLPMLLTPLLNWITVLDPWYPGRGNGVLVVARKPIPA